MKFPLPKGRWTTHIALDLEFGSSRSPLLEEKGYPEKFCGDVEWSEQLHCRGGTEVWKTTFIAENSPIHGRGNT